MLSSVKSSVEWLKENQSSCDLLLMDIQLSDGLSFEIFKEIKSVTTHYYLSLPMISML